jgi:hypothetical protein
MNEHQPHKSPIRVGITTMHRVANYGSVLQTYALQRSISNFGYDCEVIDYIYPNSYHQKAKPHGKVSLFQNIKNHVGKFLTKQEMRERAFSEFISEYIKLSEHKYPTIESLHQSPPEYDIYVSGSDQVWNTKYLDGDPTFLLDFAPEEAKRISYAASFGNSSFDQRYAALYRKHLLNFSRISVREATGMQIVTDLSNQKSQWVLDPSLLLSADDWMRLAIKPKLKKKYILCYYLGYTFNPQPYADNLAKQLCKATGYELVFIAPRPYKNKICDPTVHTVFDAGPREFLGWFANAEIVLTTSFHGTTFSITFNKKFFSIVNDAPTLDCRQKSLLEELHMHDQVLPMNTPLPDLSRLQPDYGKVNKSFEIARQKSLDFLSASLEC